MGNLDAKAVIELVANKMSVESGLDRSMHGELTIVGETTGSHVVLARLGQTAPDQVATAVTEFLAEVPKAALLELAFIGGDRDAAKAARRFKRRAMGQKVFVYHLGDDGKVKTFNSAPMGSKTLKALKGWAELDPSRPPVPPSPASPASMAFGAVLMGIGGVIAVVAGLTTAYFFFTEGRDWSVRFLGSLVVLVGVGFLQAGRALRKDR